ncbi:unnamed protein product [Ectocarpus sp. 13 AM-2016]
MERCAWYADIKSDKRCCWGCTQPVLRAMKKWKDKKGNHVTDCVVPSPTSVQQPNVEGAHVSLSTLVSDSCLLCQLWTKLCRTARWNASEGPLQFIPCDVATVCFGMAASMGAFLLGAGSAGKRKSLPNSRIMIHQPLGGAAGQAADIEIQAKEILFTKRLLNGYMAEYTDQPAEKIEEDTDRDFFMTPIEAMEYGLIDEVIKTKTSELPLPAMPSLG